MRFILAFRTLRVIYYAFITSCMRVSSRLCYSLHKILSRFSPSAADEEKNDVLNIVFVVNKSLYRLALEVKFVNESI